VRRDGGDLDDLACGPELLAARVGQADMSDHALLAWLGERGDLVFKRRVGRLPETPTCCPLGATSVVEVVKVDLFEAETPSTEVGALPPLPWRGLQT
jgi:hypothetical protein